MNAIERDMLLTQAATISITIDGRVYSEELGQRREQGLSLADRILTAHAAIGLPDSDGAVDLEFANEILTLTEGELGELVGALQAALQNVARLRRG